MKANLTRPLLLLLLILPILVSISTARDTITPSTPLADSETLVSADSKFALGFFTPAGSFNRYIGLWYNQIDEPAHTIVWVANRQHPLVNSTGFLSVRPDGCLAINAAQNKSVVWYSAISTIKLTNPVAQLLDNGNFVVKEDRDNSSDYGWQGFNYPTDTLLPDMKVGLDKTQQLNRTLVAWASSTDPSPGIYHAFMDIHGDPDFYFYQGSMPLWRAGTWDGTHLSGIPDSSIYKGIGYSFQNNDQEVTYSYSVIDQTLEMRVIVNYTGSFQNMLWISGSNQWNYIWNPLDDLCNKFGKCGPFGLCDLNASPICSCLQGFVPKNQANWNLRDWHDGCVRMHELDCKNGTDGFNVLRNVKLPQALNCTVDRGMNLAQCAEACKRNCSCIAYASDIRNGESGCLMWGGDQLLDIRNFVDIVQDLYVRVAAQDVAPVQSPKKRQITVVITVSLTLGILLLAGISCCIWRKQKWMRKGCWTLPSKFEDEDIELPLYDLDTVTAATHNFSAENKLGEGGFGPVYKGKLQGEQEVAVKRLSKTSHQGANEFKNEVLLIAKLQHRNLVRLLGCCMQGDERMLIYEYMPNKSLDSCLFEKAVGINLDWQTRYHIIRGIARGLLYLHQDSRYRIIHRDLKPSNILLDQEMTPKISDFGLARIFGSEETSARTRRVVGTYGYMSPEYALDGIFSVKSDVFSFGVLTLEIISGQRNKAVFLSGPETNLLVEAWRFWREGRSMELIDPSMDSDFSPDEVLRCINIGLLCVQENPEARPTMSSVVHTLSNLKDTSFCEPEEPGFIVKRDLAILTSINEITFSIEGR